MHKPVLGKAFSPWTVFSKRNVETLPSCSVNTNPHSLPVEVLTTSTKITPWKPSTHELLIMLSLALISMMTSLDATVIVTSLSTIVTDLHGTATLGFWLGTSYLLSSAVTMLFISALSDIFGRSPCLLLSLGLFTIGSIVGSIGKNFTALLIARCIQGIGGGGILIVSLVIFTDIVPLRYRPTYYGIIQGAWALGTLIGPLLGGVFSQDTTWRWIFYLMFPFCGIGLLSIALLLTLKPPKTTFRDKLALIDWLGGFLFISSTTAFLVAVSWGGTQEPWGSFRTVVPLVLGVLGIGATVAWETFAAREPFLHKSLFYCISSFAAYAASAIHGLLLYGLLYYIPFYFLSVKQSSPIRAGVCMLPVFLAFMPASVIIGALITRLNHFRWAIWLGWVTTTLAVGLLISWDVNTSTAAWAVILILVGLGNGFLLNSQNFATQAICQPKDEARAAAMYAFMRTFGSAIGVGIGGSVFQNVMKIKLRQLSLPTEIADNSEAYIAILRTLPADSVLKEKVLQAYVHGFHGVYGFFCGIAAFAGVLSCFIAHFDMNKVLATDQTLGENRFSQLRENRWSRRSDVHVASPAKEGTEKKTKKNASRSSSRRSKPEATMEEDAPNTISTEQEPPRLQVPLDTWRTRQGGSESSLWRSVRDYPV